MSGAPRDICAVLSAVVFASGLALAISVSPAAAASPPRTTPLAPDDGSILFPAPRSEADFSRVTAHELAGADPADPTKKSPIWSEAAFANFIANADGDARKNSGVDKRMHLPSEDERYDLIEYLKTL